MVNTVADLREEFGHILGEKKKKVSLSRSLFYFVILFGGFSAIVFTVWNYLFVIMVTFFNSINYLQTLLLTSILFLYVVVKFIKR